MRTSFLFLAAIVIAFIFTHCTKTVDPIIIEVPMITTSISGTVVDESNRPIAQATISAYGQTVMTDAQGLFTIQSVRVPEDRCTVAVRRQGYMGMKRGASPIANGTTVVRMMLLRDTVTATLSSVQGGTVTTDVGATVQFQQQGFRTNNGASYTGEVRVMARYLDPRREQYFDVFPGDLNGTRTDGSSSGMISYGVMVVEMRTPQGDTLNVQSDRPATISIPIDPEVVATAPETLPLWSMDETTGLWREEAVAQKIGNRYVGQVRHFSSWNYDYPAIFGYAQGQVALRGDLIRNARVYAGERLNVQGNVIASNTAFTDSQGNFRMNVASNRTLYIQVEIAPNVRSAPITVSALRGQESRNLGRVNITN